MQLSQFHLVQVDDESDVQETTGLAMRGFRAYGLPAGLHSGVFVHHRHLRILAALWKQAS